jgi:hypothetical protein
MTEESLRRFCIFCGNKPEDKNREHPIPQWLIDYTGKPSRTVKHGFYWSSGKVIEYSWSNFTFPSCKLCNENYSSLEERAKKIITSICERKSLNPEDYIILLDWLDKVRIGVWLGVRYLQGITYLPRNFHINDRVGKKDRMVAIYPIGKQPEGLNIYGHDTLLFNMQPSIFALRVNDILFLNISSDYIFSSRCGFPFPTKFSPSLDNGLVEVGKFKCSKKIKHPILSGLYKPSVLIFQPIVQLTVDGSLVGLSDDQLDHIKQNSWPGKSNAGILFRQYKNKTVKIFPDSAPIEFDSIIGNESKRAVDIYTQVYQLQNRYSKEDIFVSTNPEKIKAHKEEIKIGKRNNRKTLQILRSMSKEQMDAAWGKTP